MELVGELSVVFEWSYAALLVILNVVKSSLRELFTESQGSL
jgi:hypothetical protein